MTNNQAIAYAEKRRVLQRIKERNASLDRSAHTIKNAKGEAVGHPETGERMLYPVRRRAVRRALRQPDWWNGGQP